MKILKLVLFTCLLSIYSSYAQARVDWGADAAGGLLDFTGEDIAQFEFLREAIVQSGSPVAHKCFKETLRGEFGETILVDKCVIKLNRNEYDVENMSVPILKITDKKVQDQLRNMIDNNGNTVKKVFTTKLTAYRPGNGGAGEGGSGPIREITHFYRALVNHSQEHTALFCTSLDSKAKNFSKLSGCYVAFDFQPRSGVTNLIFAKPSCKTIEHTPRFILNGNATNQSVKAFRLNYDLNRASLLGNDLSDYTRTAEDELLPYNSRLLSVQFWGRNYQSGDIKCAARNPSALDKTGTHIQVTCSTDTNKKINVVDANNGGNTDGLFIFETCNYLK